MTTTPSNDAINFKAAKIVLEYLLDICEWYVQRIEYGEKLAASAFYSISEMVDVLTNNTVMDLDFAADDFEAAAQCFLVAANEGNACAQYNLGVLYNQGRGIPQSYEEAARWYQLAANQGDANAQYSLGVLYELGQGLEQNYT